MRVALVFAVALVLAPSALGHLGGGCCFRVFTGHGHADYATGHDGNSWLSGAGGADRLLGGDGHDQLFGGAGPDVLIGGPGYDYCVGGDGADVLLECESGTYGSLTAARHPR